MFRGWFAGTLDWTEGPPTAYWPALPSAVELDPCRCPAPTLGQGLLRVSTPVGQEKRTVAPSDTVDRVSGSTVSAARCSPHAVAEGWVRDDDVGVAGEPRGSRYVEQREPLMVGTTLPSAVVTV
jgi:hypothetical protein